MRIIIIMIIIVIMIILIILIIIIIMIIIIIFKKVTRHITYTHIDECTRRERLHVQSRENASLSESTRGSSIRENRESGSENI
jgi:5-bromo-4-chloroindolyl phosphate hydrolysis protein